MASVAPGPTRPVHLILQPVRELTVSLDGLPPARGSEQALTTCNYK